MGQEYNEKVFPVHTSFIHPSIHPSCMVSWWVLLVHILAKIRCSKSFALGNLNTMKSSNAMFLSAICQLHFCFFCAGNFGISALW
jgi:hypothetical protein